MSGRRAPHWAWGCLVGLCAGVAPGMLLLLLYGEGVAMLWGLVVFISVLVAWVRADD